MQFGFGLHIDSDFPISGTLSSLSDKACADIVISFYPAEYLPDRVGFSANGTGLEYSYPKTRFQCEIGKITVTPAKNSSFEDIVALLIANALPATLWLRDSFMLHASCMRLPSGKVVAVAGNSGSGKSRLAAICVERGAELIGDDSLAMTVCGDGVHAAGLPGGWFSRQSDHNHRVFIPAPLGSSRGVAQPDMIAFIDSHGPALTLLPRLQAIELLLQHRHRPQIPKLLGKQQLTLKIAADIVRILPCVRLDSANLGSHTFFELEACARRLA